MSLLLGVANDAKLETLVMLLDHGAHVGATFDDTEHTTRGFTALHYAVYSCVETHLKDADPAYSGTARSDADAVVRLLIARGAPLDVQTRALHTPRALVIDAGSTPRDIAFACNNADVSVAVAALIDDAMATRDAARAALTGT